MEIQSNTENWLDNELKMLNETSTFDGEKLPSLELIENKIVEFTIDFNKKFEFYDDMDNKTIKKIIPVTHEGVKKIWWLNVRNPIYRQVIEKGREGINSFKVMQVGNKQTTRYNLIEE